MEKQEIKNTLVLILYWASNVFLAAFTTGYLTQKGYSDMQIGLSMSIGAVFIILINYYFNDYLDKLVSKHLKRTIIITYASCIILCLLFIFRTKPDWLNVVIFSLLCSLMTHNHRLINLLCQRQKHSHHLIDGNRPADIGLISYGLTTVLFG